MAYYAGLDEESVRRSREQYGTNDLEKQKTKGIFRRFLENLSDPIIRVLLIATGIEILFSFGDCNWFEIAGILIAVLISAGVTTVSEYGSEQAFLKIQKEASVSQTKAKRNGKEVSIASSELVVGDIVRLCAGDKVDADMTVLSGRITVNEAALNGESNDAEKTAAGTDEEWDLAAKSKVFRGSVVTGGEAILRVGRVGSATFFGKVAKEVQEETRESPLKLRLAKLAGQISKIGYFLAGLVAFTYLFKTFAADPGFSLNATLALLHDFRSVGLHLLHALTLMITVVVVAVPEGLPMMITVVLSANMKKMVKDHVLVKKMVGIETAGSMNYLFTDKTGTLTKGEHQVVAVLTSDGDYTKAEAAAEGERGKIMLLAAKYVNGCRFENGEYVGGNATDRAIAGFFAKCRAPMEREKNKQSFSSEMKFASAEFSGGLRVKVGAPEKLLWNCRYAMEKDGSIKFFDHDEKEKRYADALARGERVIAITAQKDKTDFFVALIALRDRLRSGVRNTISMLSDAGIHTVMITGDSPETARIIANESGILKNKVRQKIITSRELSQMTDKEVAAILPDLCAVARALPQDKTRLVRICEEMDYVVGMTGDGVNDAPALKLADVGFAMGSGTEIAKSGADIILLDDSLDAISKTVLYGRTIFKSIRKFITFQLIMNLAACGVSLLGQIIGIDAPITIIQMLWVNIIMDTLGGLAFAGEAPLKSFMKEKPKKRDEPILSKDMVSMIAANGLYTLLLCVAFLRLPVFRAAFCAGDGTDYFLTAFYALFIFSGLANCFAARSERMHLFAGLSENKGFLFIMLFISIVQILMIFFGGSLFRAEPLFLSDLFKVILLSLTVLPFDFLRRIFRKLGSHA